jgi:hypothetical protein
MSYSFSVRGADPDALVVEVGKQFEGIAAQQSIHKKDRDAVTAAVKELAQIIDVETGKDLRASVSGSIYWTEGDVVRSVSAQISLSQDTAGS